MLARHNLVRRSAAAIGIGALAVAMGAGPVAVAAPLALPQAAEPYAEINDSEVLDVARWVTRQLAGGSGLLENYGNPDWGLTFDAVLALDAVGTGRSATGMAVDRFADTGAPWLDEATAGSGRLAKAALALAAHGATETPDGRDLMAELAAKLNKETGELGAGNDAFSQALGILALERSDGGVPKVAVDWLVSQQCTEADSPNFGAYGVPWEEGTTACDAADVDTTSLVIQALLAGGLGASDSAVTGAAQWLAANQQESGAFEAFGDTSANSTGLAAQAFVALGETQRAAKAQEFLKSTMLVCTDAQDNEPIGPFDIGAIPAAGADRATALAEGIDAIIDGARFASPHALLGLSGRTISQINGTGGEVEPPGVNCEPKHVASPSGSVGQGDGADGEGSPAPFIVVGLVVLLLGGGAVYFIRSRRTS